MAGENQLQKSPEILHELHLKAEEVTNFLRSEILKDSEKDPTIQLPKNTTSDVLDELAAYHALISQNDTTEVFLNNDKDLKITYIIKNESQSITIPHLSDTYLAIFPEERLAAQKKEVTTNTQKKLEQAAGTPQERSKGRRTALAAQLNQGLQSKEQQQSAQEKKITELLLKVQGDKELTNQDLEKLKSVSIEDIRRKSNLLAKQNDTDPTLSISEEFIHRLNAYTYQSSHPSGKTLYTLDYKKFGTDKKGKSHEQHIGLGDIILDPRITMVTVIKANGTEIQAQRGIVASGRHKGRVGFLDDKGKYVATHTGDSFIIMDQQYTPNKTDKQLQERFQEEEQARKNHTIEDPYQARLESFNLKLNINGRGKILEDQDIQNKLDAQGANGEQLIAFAKEKCQKYSIPYPVFKNLIYKESKWDFTAQNKRSTAGGLGQFLDSTWDSYKQATNNPNAEKYNPFDSIDATAWLMSKTKEHIQDLDSKTYYEQGVIYYAFHHEGAGAAPGFLRFFEKMEEIGASTKEQIRENYEQHKHLLHHKTRERVQTHGLGHLLTILKFGQIIGENAQQEIDPTSTDAVANANNLIGLPEKDKKNTKLTLNSGQNTWIFGSSIAVGIEKAARKRGAGVFGIRGYNASNFKDVLEKNIQQISQLKHPNRIVLLGLAHNGLAAGGSARSRLEKHLQLVQLIKQYFPHTQVKIAQAHRYDRPDRNQSIDEFNTLLENEPSDIYLPALPQASKLHPPHSEYEQIADKIL